MFVHLAALINSHLKLKKIISKFENYFVYVSGGSMDCLCRNATWLQETVHTSWYHLKLSNPP